MSPTTTRRTTRRSRVLPILFASAVLAFTLGSPAAQAATPIPVPQISLGVGSADSPEQVALSLQVLLLLTVLTLAPSILVMMTSFTRIIVVLSFVRSALGTNQVPPNPVLIGLALFLTFFTMAPTFQAINQQALQPYLGGQLSQTDAFTAAMKPLRSFMLKQTRESDLALFVEVSGSPRPDNPEDVSNSVLIPAFVISELKTAFELGFIIFIPFLVIDMIVSSTLMSMGMLMLPPVMISLPFKILLFVLVDGWHLIARSLILSYH